MGVKYNCNELCDYLFDKNNFSEKDTAMENSLKIKNSLYNLLKKYEVEYKTEIRFVMCLIEEMNKL